MNTKFLRKSFHLPAFFLLLCLLAGIINYAQQFEWAKNMGGSGSDQGLSITVDNSKYVYTTGRFPGTADFDPGSGIVNLTSKGGEDIYVCKLNESGELVWAKSIGGGGADFGQSITVDASGNVYVTGVFNSTVDFDPGTGTHDLTSVGEYDIFILKLDSSGNFLWAKSIGGPFTEYGNSIVLDAWGNIYITGWFNSSVDFDPGSGTNFLISQGNMDVYIAKFDNDGNFVWAKNMGGSGFDYGYAIDVDLAGYLYIIGKFQNTVDFDPGTGVSNLTSNGGYDIFVSKFDTSGNFIWVKGIGGTATDQGNSIKADGNGNIYTTGFFQATVDFDPNAGKYELSAIPAISTFLQGQDIFVSKLDSSGNFFWAVSIGGKGSDEGLSIALDPAGNIYTTGRLSDGSQADFDPGPDSFNLTSNGSVDVFLSKLDNEGKFVWAANMGGVGGDNGNSIIVDNSGNLYTTGIFGGGSPDFDPGTAKFNLTSNGLIDIFVHKMNCGDTNLVLIQETTDCIGYTIGAQTHLESGIYTHKFAKTSGCDSTIILDLTVLTDLGVQISVNEYELSTSISYNTYQWIKNGVAIPNATDSMYTATENGDYQVAVTNINGCADTSPIYRVSNITVIDNAIDIDKYINIYPNPANSVLYLQSSIHLSAIIMTLEGKLVKKTENKKMISLKGLANGMYLLRLEDLNGHLIKIEKIIKQ